MIAQAFIFFLAGFETSSTTMSNALYELALHQNIQDELRHEIKDAIKRDGKLTYDNIKDMKYLDRVFKGEFFRMSPYRMSYWISKISLHFQYLFKEILI